MNGPDPRHPFYVGENEQNERAVRLRAGMPNSAAARSIVIRRGGGADGGTVPAGHRARSPRLPARAVSGGTRSDGGGDCRNAFLGIAKTCSKLGVDFWEYLGARLKIDDPPDIPNLAQIVSARCATA
jgi:hypothetical protein